MIHVLAFASIKPGMLDKALEIYRVLVPKVLANEPGVWNILQLSIMTSACQTSRKIRT